jgi:hypothetical protein
MVVVWERRVRAAVFKQRGVPMAERLLGARLVAETRLRRWSRCAVVGLAAMIAVTALLVPALLAVHVVMSIA